MDGNRLYRWLEIAEYISVVALVAGAIAAVGLGQIIYLALAVSVWAVLNTINRFLMKQGNRRRLKIANKRLQNRFAADIQAVKQQVDEIAVRSLIQPAEPLASPPAGIPEDLSQSETFDLVPLYKNLVAQRQFLFSLHEQYTAWEESLSSVIEYLNSSLLPSRVDRLEKSCAELSQKMTQSLTQVEEIHQQLKAHLETPVEADPIIAQVDAVTPVETPDLIPLGGQQWECVYRFIGHSDWVRSLALSSDGRILASGSFDHTIKIWDLQQRKLLHTLSGHSKGVAAVAMTPDGKLLASGSWDETIKLWDVETGELQATLSGHSGSVRSLAISADGETLISGSFDRTIQLWRLPSGESIGRLTEEPVPVHAIALAPDSQMLASGGENATISLWQLDGGERIGSLTSHIREIEHLAISPDGQILAAINVQGAIILWQLVPDPYLCILQTDSAPVRSCVFSGDGKTLIAAGADGSLKIWQLHPENQLQATLRAVLEDKVMGAAISLVLSADGEQLAVGCADGAIALWQKD